MDTSEADAPPEEAKDKVAASQLVARWSQSYCDGVSVSLQEAVAVGDGEGSGLPGETVQGEH